MAIDGWIAIDRHLLCGECSWAAVSGALLHGRVVAPYRGRVGSPRRALAEAYQGVVDFKERRGDWMTHALPLARALAWSIRELCVDRPAAGASLIAGQWPGRPSPRHALSPRVVPPSPPTLRPKPLVVPVPSYRGRRPHVRLLTALASIGVPSVRLGLDVLAKTRDFTQKGLSRSERRAESEGAYIVHRYWRPFVRARHVIVADDLVTTGATLEACTRALLAAGADLVEGAAVVRVVRAPPERILSLGSRQARVQLRELDNRGRAPILAGPGLFWVLCPCTPPCPRTVAAGPYRVPALDALACHRWLCGCGATHLVRARREWQSGVRDLLAIGVDGRRAPELLVGVVQGTPVWVT